MTGHITDPDAGADPPTQRSTGSLGRPAHLLFGGYLLSSAGSGMILPYLAIYVSQVRGLGEPGAVAALAIVAAGVVAGSLAASAFTDRLGSRAVGAAGLALQALGYPLLGSTGSADGIYLACITIGLGGGTFLAVLSPTINLICAPLLHRRAFAMRYLINNLGLGVGALIAALALRGLNSAQFEILYFANGVSYVALLACYWVALAGAVPSSHKRPSVATASTPLARSLYKDRRFVLLMTVQTILVAAGFSQMQSVVPLFLSLHLHAQPALISTVLILNCVGIVIVQPIVVRLGHRVSDSRLLATVGGFWALAFVVGLGSWFGGSAGVAAILLFCGLFTIGESFYGPSFQPLLVRIAPPDRLGQYSGVSSSLWGATTFVGPPLGVLLVESRFPYTLWVVCALACAIACIAALQITPRHADPLAVSVPTHGSDDAVHTHS